MPETHIAEIAKKTGELLTAIKALADASPETPVSDEILSRGVKIRSQFSQIVARAVGANAGAKA